MGLSAAAPWLKYYGNTPASLEYPHKTMYEMVEAAAKRHPNHVAYVFMGKKTTYTEFMKRIQAAAQGLYKMVTLSPLRMPILYRPWAASTP